MKLLDGKKLAEDKLHALRVQVVASSIEPALAVLLVGDDPASHLYVDLKQKAAKKVGIEVRVYRFAADASAEEIAQCVDFLNADPETHGIIVQLPLPQHLDTEQVVALIDSSKDADGFHPTNQAQFVAGTAALQPVFPSAIMALIMEGLAQAPDRFANAGQKPLEGLHAVVVGKSDVFDRVMTAALTQSGAEATFLQVTKDHTLSSDAAAMLTTADIVVTAVGTPGLLHGELFKAGAVVIDGGIAKDGEATVGDVDVASCKDADIILSPVPGGVGPVTVACLLENVVELAQ